MPMTPTDTYDSDPISLVEQAMREQPLATAIIALLLGFIAGQCLR